MDMAILYFFLFNFISNRLHSKAFAPMKFQFKYESMKTDLDNLIIHNEG